MKSPRKRMNRSVSAPPWRDRLLAAWLRSGYPGFIRLFKLLKPSASAYPILHRNRYGSRFWLTPWDLIDKHVLVDGFYESEIIEGIRPQLADGRRIWFIGANFGLHAVTAKCIAPGTEVTAFEPNPHMGARLLRHSRLNDANVTLYNLALGETHGSVRLYVNASGNPGMSTLHPTQIQAYDECVGVGLETPARLIGAGTEQVPHVVVIDAEGAELAVLRGFGSWLSNPGLELVVFEDQNDLLSGPGESETLTLLSEHGFKKFRRLTRNEPTAHALSNFCATR